VPAWLHIRAAGPVAFGTTMSAFWTIVLNSRMHTPQGFEMVYGVAFATDRWAIIFIACLASTAARGLTRAGPVQDALTSPAA